MGDKISDEELEKLEEELDKYGDDWENDCIRETLIKIGDEEALLLFDKDRERVRKKAEKEVMEMARKGLLLLDDE